MASKPSSSAESDGLPWHGDFAGNATDGILLLIGGLLTLCALSGAWWMLWHALFLDRALSLVFFMSLHLEYNTQVDLDKAERHARRLRQPRSRGGSTRTRAQI